METGVDKINSGKYNWENKHTLEQFEEVVMAVKVSKFKEKLDNHRHGDRANQLYQTPFQDLPGVHQLNFTSV